MNFASTLKHLRKSNDVTQEQLAKHLQVTRSAIAGYETKNKQPDFEKLVRIANYFHVSVDYLLTGLEPTPVSIAPSKIHSEKILDHYLITSYRKLSVSSKQDLVNYLQLLELREKTKGLSCQ
ncbi:helix-turn-helix domain-containing protein [Hespellia stercorisuis]|uniref:Transcriptional regulator, contains XRE-family HTH domain n=1 Tax=Hespellia stercorisuis DSM 15480 TaxID=1121950 RepID=A0A1M6HVT1_9FIRM|nr:helix-turn-helix transcriptional regulator [Hespellia stercorisuis]SHJ26360.1 Transcriptional regulator, contains XRE-family HTH domain [Hespellia stercorisuis DSM 15480]